MSVVNPDTNTTAALDQRAGSLIELLRERFGDQVLCEQATLTGMPVLWVNRGALVEVLAALRRVPEPFEMLYDLSAIDERLRSHRHGLPEADFTVFYQLLSVSGNRDIMLKVALSEHDLSLPTVIPVYPNANWYEREVWDMFGIRFEGHPNLYRILMPPTWQGHPLRKDHHARATEFDPYTLTVKGQEKEQQALQFKPEEWGMQRQSDNTDFMFLNLGPNHPSAHGAFRIVLQLDGEEIIDCVPDIGYHHRGAEKMAERQSWHSFIPYTDRIDYVGGVMNNLPYVLAVEKLAGIQVTERAQTIRVMMAELFRITSHLLFLGTYLQDIGAMSPVFYAFTDRQKGYDVIEAITGFRMHPAWYRIGGVMQDLPKGWDTLMQGFVNWMPARLKEYERAMMENSLVRDRTKHITAFDTANALAWGVTGPNLRATGCDFDLRKQRPYSGYENFDFEIPLAHNGDAFDRGQLRIEEMRQSVRILQHARRGLQGGSSADHAAAPRAHARAYRNPDYPFFAGVLGASAACQRIAADDRGHQRYQQLLPDQ